MNATTRSWLLLDPIPWARWTLLTFVAVAGSCVFGASLSLVLADWNVFAAAIWLALSAGLAWCVLVPVLCWIGDVRPVPCLDACLVTMAFGEIVLTAGALMNGVLWRSGAVAHAALLNALVVGISNVVMAAVLMRRLRLHGVPPARVLAAWMLALNGSGALFFAAFHHLLHGA